MNALRRRVEKLEALRGGGDCILVALSHQEAEMQYAAYVAAHGSSKGLFQIVIDLGDPPHETADKGNRTAIDDASLLGYASRAVRSEDEIGRGYSNHGHAK
jgi:hypothetical protein